MLTREMILGADDLPRKEIEVPEWGGSIYVRALSGAERVVFERVVFSDAATDESVMAQLVALCAVDEKGERLFSEADVEALNQKNAKALSRVANAAILFNALSAEGVEEQGNG